MKSLILALFVTVFFVFNGNAQAYEGSIDYSKKKQEAFVREFAFSSEALANAIVQKLEKMGYKGKEEKGLFNKDRGFRVYKAAFITDISEDRLDYIIKVESKSRKEKDESVLYMIIIRDGVNAMKIFDAYDVDRAKSFLNNLVPDVEAADLELQIKAQEETVSKAEKKLKDLLTSKDDMEKKIKGLQEDIKNNLKDQEKTQKDIEDQQQALELLKTKRKPGA